MIIIILINFNNERTIHNFCFKLWFNILHILNKFSLSLSFDISNSYLNFDEESKKKKIK